MADGKRRSRLLAAYENHGAVLSDETAEHRFFDLRPSDLLSSLRGRLVVEWSGDAINWAKRGGLAEAFPIVEIAEPADIPFPGFDRVLASFAELQDMVDSACYLAWQNALSSVHGVLSAHRQRDRTALRRQRGRHRAPTG